VNLYADTPRAGVVQATVVEDTSYARLDVFLIFKNDRVCDQHQQEKFREKTKLSAIGCMVDNYHEQTRI
jgi:hypothetical protein